MTNASFRAGTALADTIADTVTYNKPAGVQDGDLIIVGTQVSAAADCSSLPTGFVAPVTNPADVIPGPHGKLQFFTKIASSEPTSWDFGYGASSGHKIGVCGAYKNVGAAFADTPDVASTSGALGESWSAGIAAPTGGLLVVYVVGTIRYNFPTGGMKPITYPGTITEDIAKDNSAGDNDKNVSLASEIVAAGVNLGATAISWPNACASLGIRTEPVKASAVTAAPGFGFGSDPFGGMI